MRTLPDKFTGKYISFKTEEEAWRIAKILEDCGYRWEDNARPGDRRDWIEIYIACYRKDFSVVGGRPIEHFTAQEFFEEMEGTTEATQKLKVGDRVKHREIGALATVKCIHEDHACLDRDDGGGKMGCDAWWANLDPSRESGLGYWDLVKEEEREGTTLTIKTLQDAYGVIKKYQEDGTPIFLELNTEDMFLNRFLQSNQLTPTPMCEEKTILQRIKALATPEPERTLQEERLMNGDGSLTLDGKILLERLLVEDYKGRMKELVDETKPKKKAKKKKA